MGWGMTFHEPAHGWWCGARTYPTRCRLCGANVFYFSCHCGCKVFFDSLGWPWPEHDCVGNVLRQVEISIAEDYARRVAERQEHIRQGWKIPIRACQASGNEPVEDTGVVRDVVPGVSVFKKLNLQPDSPFAAALLGELADDDCTQITVHVDDPRADETISYTLLISTDSWQKAQGRRGDVIRFEAVGLCIPGRPAIWVCRSVSLA